MKKKILGIAMAVMALVAVPSIAQTPASQDGAKKECCKENCDKNKKCDKAGKGQKCDNGQQCAKGQKPGKAGKQFNPFEGLSLTEAQQAQINQLQEKCKTERQAKAEAAKCDKQKCDSVKAADRQAAKKAYLEEVKTILGPEQYVVFLENVYMNAGHQNGGKQQAFKQGPKGDRPQMKGNRPQMKGDRPNGPKAPKTDK